METEELQNLELHVSQLGKLFLEELMLLRLYCKANLTGRAKEVRIVAASACSTGNAIHILSEKPEYFYAETVMLARSYVEKMVNFVYLHACDDDEYERFLLHPLYRAYHNADKSKFAGQQKIGITYSGREQMKLDSRMQQALSIFSETNSKLSWSKLGIDQKIAIIKDRSKVSTAFFLLNTLTIYSDASEALHGSLYGCALPTKAYIPGSNTSNTEVINKSLLQDIALMYVQMSSLIHELLKISTEVEGIQTLLEKSTEFQKEAVSTLKKMFPQKSNQ